ncbi:MAG: oligosaccharide flippase family protein [Lachnospiraceae bacterium]
MKLKNNPFIMGTLILSATGFITRIIGFFYRIFISQKFGEEAMGIYQLIAPVLALSFSLSAAGIQTAISKYVAKEPSSKDYQSSFHYLFGGILLSLLLSSFYSTLVFFNADFIATHILLESRCAMLIKIIALSFPFGSIHCCINGYYYGIKKTKLPALTQLCEQCFRVSSIFLLYYYFTIQGKTPSIGIAAIGLFIGEVFSALIGILILSKRMMYLTTISPIVLTKKMLFKSTNLIFKLSIPLTINRIVINLLQSVEAIYIPNKLQSYGLATSEALIQYGVLTGMSLSLILFPSAFTNSASVLLLPYVSEAEANNNTQKIKRVIQNSIRLSIMLGVLCTFVFFFFGKLMGNILFHSELAGKYIVTLSFICPFLYITTTLSSILHGLGKTLLTFIINISSLSLRIIFIFYVIPIAGMYGYLIGLLLSQLLSTLLCTISLKKYLVS